MQDFLQDFCIEYGIDFTTRNTLEQTEAPCSMAVSGTGRVHEHI
jgi:hypothetical protein